MAASGFYQQIEKGSKSRYNDEDSKKAYEDVQKEDELREQKKKKKLAERTKKKKPQRNTSNLVSFGGTPRKKSSGSGSTSSVPKTIDPLLEMLSGTNGQVINPNGNASQPNQSSSISPVQDMSIIERKKREGEEEESQSSKFDYNEFEMKLLGMLEVWDPMRWNMNLLCKRSVTHRFRARLAEFESGGKDICYTDNTRMMRIIKTKPEELVHMPIEMVKIHVGRQNMRVFTPFLMLARWTSNLPIDIQIISQCELEDDKQTTRADSCNQLSVVTGLSSDSGETRILLTIPAMSTSTKSIIVTDNRNVFTDKSSSNSFQLNLQEVEGSIVTTVMGGTHIMGAKIKVGSYFERVISGLSQTFIPSLSEMKRDAEDLMCQIRKSPKYEDNGVFYYNQVDYYLTMKCKDHIEKIRLSVPKYEIMAYKAVPVPGASWTDSSTWSIMHMNQLGLLGIEPQEVKALCETRTFDLSLTIDYIFI